MQATATIKGLDFILLPTQDLNRAVTFYRDVLGLEVESPWGEMGMEFKIGNDLTLAVMDSKAIGRPFAAVTGGTIALKVVDVEATVKELQAKGVVFEHELIDSGVCKMMPFSDPDGNSLMLHHRYAE
jgi:predicted enzyme related to lactoylglutathione lyase